MAKDLNGAWLALGVAGAVAAAGVALGLSGSRALSGVDDLRRMTGKKPWSEMTQEEREREERDFQRFKQESRDEISRGRKKMEREPDWHTAWHDTSGELGQPADRATYDEDGFRIDSREAARKRREADREADRDELEAKALRSRRRGPLPEGSMARDGGPKTFVPVTMLGRGGAAEYAKNARGTLIYRFWEISNDPWKLVAT